MPVATAATVCGVVIAQMKKEKNRRRKRESLRCDKKVWDMG